MKPYYEDAFVRLYHADCRELLPGWNIDNALLIADPCYGQTSLPWDKWDPSWLRYIPSEIRTMWVFGTLRMFMHHANDFQGWKMSQDIVWEKHNGSSFHNDRFRRVHEQVCHFYRGRWATVPHFVPTTPDAVKRTVRRKQRPTHMGEIGGLSYRSIDGGPRLQRSVLQVRSAHGEALHPTQKPLGIIRPLIQYGTQEGGHVIVPFAGAGSELIAAKQLGRKADGAEIVEEYCEQAAKRLSQGVLEFASV